MIPSMLLGGLGRNLRVAAAAYSYWNPADKNVNITLTDGNKVAKNAVGNNASYYARSVTAKSSGKWRVEFLPEVTAIGTGTHAFGFATSASLGTFLGNTATGWGMWWNYTTNGRVYTNNAFNAYAGTIAVNDVISLMLDIDAGKAWWAKNGTVISGNPVAGTGEMATFTPGTTILLACAPAGVNDEIRLRTNPTEMTASPVSGFTDGWPN